MPLTRSQIQELESTFAVSLPRTYRRFLSEDSELLNRPCIHDRPDLGAIADEWALHDLGALLELNLEFREMWQEMEFNQRRSAFPSHRFLIGTIDGDLLAVNTRRIALFRVFVYRHEYGWWLPFALTWNHFTNRLLAKTVQA